MQPVIANPCRTVVRQLNSAKIQEKIGSQFIVVRMADAVRLCQVQSAPAGLSLTSALSSRDSQNSIGCKECALRIEPLIKLNRKRQSEL